ncbi:MAG: ASKHA domain-containing protein [Candidatus Adiutrix sp.]
MRVILKEKGKADSELSAHEGQTVFSFLANLGVYLDAPCAGRGKCGKCLVKAEGNLSAPLAAETEMLGDSALRLACQTHFLGEATVEIASAARFSSVKGLGEAEPYDLDSPLKLRTLKVLNRQESKAVLHAHGLKGGSTMALNALAKLDCGRKTGQGVVWGDELLAVWDDEGQGTEANLLAAAIDLGTTGLAVAIIDVVKGEIIAQGTALNPQTSRGGDVISRITASGDSPDGLAELQTLITDGLGRLILETAGEKANQVMASVISGNTTMIYLLAGISPQGLAQAPYRPIFTESLDISHLAQNLSLGSGAKVLTTPCISAYVGGDITSGMLAVGLEKLKGAVLYIDIGTNGEIVLSHKGHLVATSCAAGPALEGMNIICGQRATPGAIDSFFMNPDFTYRLSTIGHSQASGICGSGLIDACAELIRCGFIDKTGRLKPPKGLNLESTMLKNLTDGRFYFTDKVFLDQKDIRQVQLAKGALAAAIELLLGKMGLTESDLDEIIVAGAFGFHLKAESLKAISLIPLTYEGPVRFVGNSSLAGAARMVLNSGALEELNNIAQKTEVLELGFDLEFQKVFVKHLNF